MQILYYTPASSSLYLEQENGGKSYWNNVTSLVTSASLYQIVAFTGSDALAYFPLNGTNVFLSPFPSYGEEAPTPPSSSIAFLNWQFVSNIGPLLESTSTVTGSTYYLVDTANSIYYASQSTINSTQTATDNGSGTLFSSSFTIYLAGTTSSIPYLDYTSSIIFKNITTGYTTSSFASGSAQTFNFTSSNNQLYEITMSLYYYSLT